MALHRKQMSLLRFIATDQRLIDAGPEAALLYLRLVFWTEDFGARHPDLHGEHWPSDEMWARRCRLSMEEYRACLARLAHVGLYENEGQGGFALVLPA